MVEKAAKKHSPERSIQLELVELPCHLIDRADRLAVILHLLAGRAWAMLASNSGTVIIMSSVPLFPPGLHPTRFAQHNL
jgi:hypothetical protein